MRAAYLRADYEAAGLTLRIGARSRDFDALLRRHRACSAAFVTAWNPFSRRMPEGWNDRMLARMRDAARARVLAEGIGSADRWWERHLLVAGDPRWIARLARRFRQNAIVVIAPGLPAALWWTGP